MELLRRQPAKWSEEASRGSFWSISGATPQSGPRRLREGRFGAFEAPGTQVAPGGLERVGLQHFRRQPANMDQGKPYQFSSVVRKAEGPEARKKTVNLSNWGVADEAREAWTRAPVHKNTRG